MTHAITAATVAELAPVAAAALHTQGRDGAVRDIRRALLRNVGQDVYRACDIAAEALVALAEERAEPVDEPPAMRHIRLASDFPDNQPLGGGARG